MGKLTKTHGNNNLTLWWWSCYHDNARQGRIDFKSRASTYLIEVDDTHFSVAISIINE